MSERIYLINDVFDLYVGKFDIPLNVCSSTVLQYINNSHSKGMSGKNEIHLQNVGRYQNSDLLSAFKDIKSARNNRTDTKNYAYFGDGNIMLDNMVFYMDFREKGNRPDSNTFKRSRGVYNMKARTAPVWDDIELEGKVYLLGAPDPLEKIRERNTFLAMTDVKISIGKGTLPFVGVNPNYIGFYSVEKV